MATPSGPTDPLSIPHTLVLTGHFPPETGGVQTFVAELLGRLPAARLTVVATAQRGSAALDAALPYPVVRRRGYWLSRDLPRLVAASGAEAAWIPALAPIGLFAGAVRRAGVQRVVASTHGQELGWLRVAPTRASLRAMSRRVDVLTHLSPTTAARLRPAVAHPERLVELPGGVDPSLFSPGAGPARAGRGPTVLSVARLVRRKGFDVLLDAWPRVLAAVPQARLVLAGEGPLRGPLERAAARPALRGSVEVTGPLPQAELVAALRRADVFVLACRDARLGLQTEGLGLSVLEASACGLPVVVGRSGGSSDAVQPGTTGLLVDAASPGAVAAALVELLGDPARSAAMGAAGAAWAPRRWSWDRSARVLAAALRGDPPQRTSGEWESTQTPATTSSPPRARPVSPSAPLGSASW